MSEIKTKTQNWPVRNKEDVIALYEGMNTNPNFADNISRIGMEVEYNLYKAKTLAPLTEEESALFIGRGERKALGIHNEPSATTLEILSDAHEPENFSDLIDQIDQRFKDFWALGCENLEYPSPFGYLPHIKPEEHHQTKNERYVAFWVPPRPDLVEAYHSFVDPSIQVSISYRDYDHLLKIIRLAVVLEPFLILTTEADGGFYEGGAVNGSPRTRILKRRGRNGGVPEFYLRAKTGAELIDSHIDFTLNNEHVFVCFNHDGKLVELPDYEWSSFLNLEKNGYGPCDLLNYRQAQSESWRRTANIAELRDDEGTLFGHRVEISSLFCTGLQHQRHTAAVLSCLIAYCSGFYREIDRTLRDEFGIDMDDLYASKDLLTQNFENVYAHNGRYFDLPFGTKTVKDFAERFITIADGCLQAWGLKSYAKPLMHILKTGRPDWLVHRELFETLDQQKAYMSALPELVKEEPCLICPDHCADMTKDTIKEFLNTYDRAA